MRKCLFLLVLLCGTLINLNGQDTSLVCQPFVPVVLDVSGNNCQGEVSPFDLLIGDLSDFSEGDFQINIFDDNPVNGGILDGVGPFLLTNDNFLAKLPLSAGGDFEPPRGSIVQRNQGDEFSRG